MFKERKKERKKCKRELALMLVTISVFGVEWDVTVACNGVVTAGWMVCLLAKGTGYQG